MIHPDLFVANQILWAAGQDSAVHTYDAGGRLVMKAYEDKDGGLKIGDRTLYDGEGHALTVIAEDKTDPNQLYVKEKRTYDLNGRETERRTYYARGTVKSSFNLAYGQYTKNVEGWLKGATLTAYDLDGRQTQVDEHHRKKEWFDRYAETVDGWSGVADPDDHDANHDEVSNDPNESDLSKVAWTTYQGYGVGAGTLSQFLYRKDLNAEGEDGVHYTHEFVYEYRDGESREVLSIEGTASNVSSGSFAAADSAATFDAFGRRVTMIYDVASGSTKREDYSFDGDGNELYRYGRAKSGVRPQVHYTWAGGQLVGQNFEDGGVHYKWGGQVQEGRPTGLAAALGMVDARKGDFRLKYDVAGSKKDKRLSESQSYGVRYTRGLTGYQAGGGSYTVVSGDTLRDIAQKVYGHEGLWYLIADANGLNSDSDLTAGLRLTVPETRVTGNDASTFKPFEPKALPMPQLEYQPPQTNAFISALAAVVALIVVICVAKYGAKDIAAWAKSSLRLGTLGQAAVVGGAAAAAGEAARQAIQIAGGNQNGFDAQSFLGATFGGAIAGGIGSELGSVSDILKDAAKFSDYAKAFGIALTSSVGNYAGQKLAGMDTPFSWKSLAAGSVGTVVGGAFVNAAGIKPYAAGLAENLISQGVRAAARLQNGIDPVELISATAGGIASADWSPKTKTLANNATPSAVTNTAAQAPVDPTLAAQPIAPPPAAETFPLVDDWSLLEAIPDPEPTTVVAAVPSTSTTGSGSSNTPTITVAEGSSNPNATLIPAEGGAPWGTLRISDAEMQRIRREWARNGTPLGLATDESPARSSIGPRDALETAVDWAGELLLGAAPSALGVSGETANIQVIDTAHRLQLGAITVGQTFPVLADTPTSETRAARAVFGSLEWSSSRWAYGAPRAVDFFDLSLSGTSISSAGYASAETDWSLRYSRLSFTQDLLGPTTNRLVSGLTGPYLSPLVDGAAAYREAIRHPETARTGTEIAKRVGIDATTAIPKAVVATRVAQMTGGRVLATVMAEPTLGASLVVYGGIALLTNYAETQLITEPIKNYDFNTATQKWAVTPKFDRDEPNWRAWGARGM